MEITLIYKQTGKFWTAAAFAGGAFAGLATCTSRPDAGAQARAIAEDLVQRNPPPLPTPARLGGRAKVGSFSLHISKIGSCADAIVQTAHLAALAAPLFPKDEAAAAAALAA